MLYLLLWNGGAGTLNLYPAKAPELTHAAKITKANHAHPQLLDFSMHSANFQNKVEDVLCHPPFLEKKAAGELLNN